MDVLPYALLAAQLCIVLACGFAFRGALDREDGRLALGVSATVLGVWLLSPHGRIVPNGHALTYLDVLARAEPLTGHHLHSPFVSMTGSRAVAWVVGLVPGAGDGLLRFVSGAMGAAAAAGLALLLRRLGGLGAAWVGGLALALDPQRAFWSLSGFPAVASLALLVGVAVCGAAAVRREGRLRWLAAVGAGVLAGAIPAFRVDALPGLAVAFVLAVAAGPWRAAVAPAALAGLLGGALGAAHLRLQGTLSQHTSGDQVRHAVDHLAALPALLAPWLGSVVLGVSALGLALSVRRARDGARDRAGLLGVCVLVAAVVAALPVLPFPDLGARHLLPVRLGAAAGVALLLGPSLGGPRRGVAAVGAASLALALAASTVDTLQRAWGGERHLAAEAALLPASAPSLASLADAGCALITNDDYSGTPRDADLVVFHLAATGPDGAAAIAEQHGGCLIWMRSASDHRWDDVVVRSRALILEATADWTSLGRDRTPLGQDVVVWWWSGPGARLPGGDR